MVELGMIQTYAYNELFDHVARARMVAQSWPRILVDFGLLVAYAAQKQFRGSLRNGQHIIVLEDSGKLWDLALYSGLLVA